MPKLRVSTLRWQAGGYCQGSSSKECAGVVILFGAYKLLCQVYSEYHYHRSPWMPFSEVTPNGSGLIVVSAVSSWQNRSWFLLTYWCTTTQVSPSDRQEMRLRTVWGPWLHMWCRMDWSDQWHLLLTHSLTARRTMPKWKKWPCP